MRGAGRRRQLACSIPTSPFRLQALLPTASSVSHPVKDQNQTSQEACQQAGFPSAPPPGRQPKASAQGLATAQALIEQTPQLAALGWQGRPPPPPSPPLPKLG